MNKPSTRIMAFAVVSLLGLATGYHIVKAANKPNAKNQHKVYTIPQLHLLLKNNTESGNEITIKGIFAGNMQQHTIKLHTATENNDLLRDEDILYCKLAGSNASIIPQLSMQAEIVISGTLTTTNNSPALINCSIISINEGVIPMADVKY
jgi:hypothetical protein